MQSIRILFFVTTFALSGYAQITYFEQDFNGPGPFVNPNPGVGEFNQLIETAPAYIAFQNGAMEMVRTQGSQGGSVSAIRSVAFSPNPETLYIQITLTVKESSLRGNPAAYFYVGENMATTRFPDDKTVFANISIGIGPTRFVVRDPGTKKNSDSIDFKTPVNITMVLNNSLSSTVYKMPESAVMANYALGAQRYDIWVNNQQLVVGGVEDINEYSPGKLSNFFFRFYNGVGTISIDKIRIRDIDGVLPVRFKTFTAQLIEKDAALFWEAEKAEDFKSFKIQRSRDNLHFESIGEVTTSGSLGGVYRFDDTDTPLGISYYRVVQMDNNDQEVAQSIVRDIVNNSSEKSPGVWPNPSDGTVIHLFNIPESAIDLKLLNIQGLENKVHLKRVDKSSVDLTPESLLSSGLYLITYMHEGKHKSLKLLVGVP